MIYRDVNGDAVAIMCGKIKDADAYIAHLEKRHWW